jgi:inosine/xanthosine triphosphatase
MKKIIVASKNPVKINAALEGFKLMFPHEKCEVEGIAAPSGVADQPMSDNETYTGALNRVTHIAQTTQADYWVAFEGGMEEKDNEFEVAAWVIVKSKEGKIGKGRSATFFLPPAVSKLIREGKELAHAADIVFNETESGKKQGTIGILTNNVIDRTKYYIDPMVMALVPFKNPDLY